MIDPKYLRQETKKMQEMLKNRQHDSNCLTEYIRLDQQWRKKLEQVDQLKATRNHAMPQSKPSPEQRAALKAQSEKIKQLDQDVTQLAQQRHRVALTIPNKYHDTVPIGKSEKDNCCIRTVGTVPKFSFVAKSHDELGKKLDILDMENAAKMTGSRFSVLKNKGARLERVLIEWMLEVHYFLKVF